mmetsp:Transcript_9091/g.25399  ORF Transcript_9091/g.25399 Transcript_9091/m.25399 type:complete len:259 (-) Transcript_9091:228-1004(-)
MAVASSGSRFDAGGITVELAVPDDHVRQGCEDVTGFELWRPARISGALGVCCGILGAAAVLLTDREPAVLRLASRSAALSGAAARCDFVAVDFARGRPPWRSGVFDLAVASDVLFLDRLARPLLGTLRALVGEHGSSCAVAAPASTEQIQKLTAVVGHEVRRAVYRGPDGQPSLEPDDSALEEFLRAAGPRARCVGRAKATSNTSGNAGSVVALPETEVATVLLHWPVAQEHEVPAACEELSTIPPAEKRARYTGLAV